MREGALVARALWFGECQPMEDRDRVTYPGFCA